MKTWKMNLLGKRANTNSKKGNKFNFCMENRIVGIGWVGIEDIDLPEDDKDFNEFKKAKSKLDSFEPGDFVWIEVPEKNEMCLCLIKSKIQKAESEEFLNNDIGYYCDCEYVGFFTPQKLPKKLLYQSLNLHSRWVVAAASEAVNTETNKLYSKLTKKKKSFKEIFGIFVGSIKKYWYIYAIVLAIILSAIITVSVLNNKKANQVKEYIEGRTFITVDSLYKDYVAYSFKDGKFAKEEVSSYLRYSESDGKIAGDINNFAKKYKIKASIFSDVIWIMGNGDGNYYYRDVAVYLDNGVVKKYKHTNTTPEWSETTVDNIEELRKDLICRHNLETPEILKEATCSAKGKETGVCTKCNETVTREITTLPHNYVNGYCSVCGKEKPIVNNDSYGSGVTTPSDIKANTWYIHKDVLIFQNCEISSSAVTAKNVVVMYYPVCQHCHIKSNSFGSAGVEFNYPVSKIYYCKNCSKNTTVKFQLK